MKALRVAWAFARRDFLVESSYRASAFFALVGGLFALWTFYFLSRTIGPNAASMARYGGDYFRFALVGTAMAAVLRQSLTHFGRKVREAQVAGSLEALFATPVHPVGLVAASSVYPLLMALVRAVALLAAGAAFFGADFSRANVVAAALSLLLGLLAFSSFGMISAAIVLLFKRGDPLAWAMDAATVMLSGTFYPVEVLPRSLRFVSNLLPATHALAALRANLLFGAGIGETLPSLLTLMGFAVGGGALAVAGLAYALRRAEQEGTLSQA